MIDITPCMRLGNAVMELGVLILGGGWKPVETQKPRDVFAD